MAKQANHLASNMRETMIKVTKMRRAERRSRETVAIAKTTPAMTLKRLVRPEQVGDFDESFKSILKLRFWELI